MLVLFVKILRLITFTMYLFALPFSYAIADTGDIFDKKYEKSLGKTLYIASSDNCIVTLTVFDNESVNSHVLQIRRNCELDIAIQIGLISALLAELKNDEVIGRISTIAWGYIKFPEYQKRIAMAALESPVWLSMIEGGKKNKVHKNIPELNDILNEALVFREIISIFNAIGYDLSVSSVEGVLTTQAKNILNIEKASAAIVPYTARVWFRLSK